MEKTFEAKLELLQEMIQFVLEHARQVGFDQREMSRIELIAEEVLVNIINYGYTDEPGDIHIDCSAEEDTLKLIVSDKGMPFDPVANAKHIDTKAPLEERTYGGYGIFFILRVMDEVNYKRVEGRNYLIMTKGLKKREFDGS